MLASLQCACSKPGVCVRWAAGGRAAEQEAGYHSGSHAQLGSLRNRSPSMQGATLSNATAVGSDNLYSSCFAWHSCRTHSRVRLSVLATGQAGAGLRGFAPWLPCSICCEDCTGLHRLTQEVLAVMSGRCDDRYKLHCRCTGELRSQTAEQGQVSARQPRCSALGAEAALTDRWSR